MPSASGRSETVASAPAPVFDAIKVAPLGLLVVQPTTFCNIDCSYCYLSHRAENHRMDVATVRAIARFLRGVELPDAELSIVWHAGEPLTAPVAFYETAFEALRSDAGTTLFRHHFQTNARLINDEWCQ